MVYRCSVCGYLFDEEREGRKFSELKACPLCGQPPEKMEPAKQPSGQGNSLEEQAKGEASGELPSLEYPRETRKTDSDYRYMKEIHEMAVSGKSIIEAMGTRRKMPDWDDILILGAQLNPPPLSEHAQVSAMTVIGKNAKRPMVLGKPHLYFPHVLWCFVKGGKDRACKRKCDGGDGHVQR